jgi:hypothetical protein
MITCIDSTDFYTKTSLTIGRRYLVTERDNIGFRIIDDFGNEYWYDSSRFEPIEITRNNILEDLGI